VTAKQWALKKVTGVFKPTVDGNFLTKSPLESLRLGEYQKKNVLVGLNSHEGSYFILYAFPRRFDPTKPYNDNITSEEYREMISRLKILNLFADSPSDEVIDTVAAAYSLPCGSEGNTGDSDAISYLMSLEGMYGDVWFKCPVVRLAKSFASQVTGLLNQ